MERVIMAKCTRATSQKSWQRFQYSDQHYLTYKSSCTSTYRESFAKILPLSHLRPVGMDESQLLVVNFGPITPTTCRETTWRFMIIHHIGLTPFTSFFPCTGFVPRLWKILNSLKDNFLCFNTKNNHNKLCTAYRHGPSLNYKLSCGPCGEFSVFKLRLFLESLCFT